MFDLLRDKGFLKAVALLVGAMIGVGIYGIPFVFAKTGFLLGVTWLIALTLMVGLLNTFYGALASATPGSHHIAGYANIWIGPITKRIAMMAQVLGVYGAAVASMVVAGEFLRNVTAQWISLRPELYVVIFVGIWSLALVRPVRRIASLELGLTSLYILGVLMVVGFGVSHIEVANFSGVTWELWLLPYGVLLFALAGMNAIPMMRQFLAHRRELLGRAIWSAMAIVATVYLLFAFVVVGVSGDATSPEAFAGLYDQLGLSVLTLGSLIGILTISTAFIAMGGALVESFRADYKIRPFWAWFFTVIPPLLLYISGMRNFIETISIVGILSVGIQSCIILVAYIRARKSIRAQGGDVPVHSLFMAGAVAFVFLAGIFYTFIK